MVELGRQARGEPAIAAALDELERGGFYERALALQSCYGSRDGARVVRALKDKSTIIRKVAVGLAALVCDDTQARQALEAASRTERRGLIDALSARKRHALVDEFIEAVAGRDDPDLGWLIRWASPELARRRLDLATPSMADHDWTALARRHPVLVVDALREQAEQVEYFDQQLLRQVNAVASVLAEAAPDQAVALVRGMLRHVAPRQLMLQRLVERRPSEMADLLDRLDRGAVRFDRVAHRLDTGRLLGLVERQPESVYDRELWLARLPPEQRKVVHDAAGLSWRDDDGRLSQGLVALLPRAIREAEARRHLALAALATRPVERLPYTAFLPWDEARAVLDPFMRNPDPDLRAAALSALIEATRFDRVRLAEMLDLVVARGNEQDPLRLAMIDGLTNLPPGRWQTEHLDRLGQILRQALDAADLSTMTAHAATRLVVTLLPRYPMWGAEWLGTLVRERGRLDAYDLQRRLTDDDMRRIAPALLPVLQTWENREREQYLLTTAQSLGRRLRVFEGLLDLIERVLRATRSPWVSDQALSLLAEHRRYRLDALVPRLLREDPSWITRPVVYGYLHRRRQELLTPFLGQKAYRGRFSTGKTYFLLPLYDGFGRWTAEQQTTFAETLMRVAGETDRDTPAVLGSIQRLAALPAPPPTRLIQLASDKRLAVREASLRSLGRLDAGDGVPTLIEALSDDRARIAIYALRQTLLRMPADDALRLLEAAPLDRVTVAKEVVRLVGELGSENAYGKLLELDGQDLHRDVRIALLRAFWGFRDRDTTWAILRRAAVADDSAIARAVGRVPPERLNRAARDQLVELLASLLDHADPLVRIDVLRRCKDLPVADPRRRLLPPLLAAMNSRAPDECAAAAEAVFQTYAGRDVTAVGEAIAGLRANRRALWTAVETLRQALRWNRQHLLRAAREVLTSLAGDPLTVSLRVTLAAAALPWDELAALVTSLTRTGELHPQALASLGQAIEAAAFRSDAIELATLELALRPLDDPAARWLALRALVTQARIAPGWTDDRWARLHAYRADPAPMVAASAQFTFPADEPA